MNDALARHIGNRLRGRRRRLGLSQAALGAACGCSFQNIHKYETGAVQLSAASLYVLARALEAPVSYFFEGFNRSPGQATGDRDRPGAAVA